MKCAVITLTIVVGLVGIVQSSSNRKGDILILFVQPDSPPSSDLIKDVLPLRRWESDPGVMNLYPVVLQQRRKRKMMRDRFIEKLQDKGIGSRRFIIKKDAIARFRGGANSKKYIQFNNYPSIAQGL